MYAKASYEVSSYNGFNLIMSINSIKVNDEKN